MLPEKQSQSQLPTNIIGLGSLHTEELRVFAPSDAFLIVSSKRPKQLKMPQIPSMSVLSSRQERAQIYRDVALYEKVEKIHSYLRKVAIKMIDCQLKHLQFRIDTVNRILAGNEFCSAKMQELQKERQLRAERRRQRVAQARVRRIISGEAQARFCQFSGQLEINSIA